jgi:D-serine deaminase-like pyridoxal phosphate-dependent protein
MNQNSYPQAALIGAPKTAVDTPALLVDLDVMEANMARVLATCRKNGVAWRPHCKGHKSPDIARREVAAGAIGVTCAKLGEAEVMAAAGISDILIANQVVGATKVARLMQLLDKARVVVAVDSVANVEELARAATSAGKTAEVVIEVDVGMQRAGVAPGDPVLELAKEIAARPGVKLVGLFTWESQATRIADQAEKARVVQSALSKVASTAKACADAGHSMAIVSCGGTGTFPYCAEQQGISEIQAGGAIFSDVHYREHYHTDFAPALTILATVTSRPNPTRIILDAGRKAMSCDMAMPAPLGLPVIAEVKLSAEHGKIELAAPSDTPRIGDKIELICGYSDSTVFLHDQIVAVRKGRIEAIWPLLARGKLA